jgi:hypothetical protein
MVTLERVGKLVAEYRDRIGAGPRRRGGLTPDAIRKGPPAAAIAKRERAREFYEDIIKPVWKLRDAGLPLRAIAHILNTEGHTTRRGCRYNAAQVMRVLNLVDA